MRFKKLSEWLEWLQTLHVTDMDLSLERVTEVARRLNLLTPSSTVVTVGGTNGKGSCVAGIEAIYLAAGFRVGAFTSPILFKHNEYIRIQGKDVDDEQFCLAFNQIDSAREDITLTPFEFNALAAFIIFKEANLDLWVLEVGLGGRFDAVNVIDADVALVASIGIDHVEWLGDTREKIAYEKAGIFRKDKPAICGDLNPPHTLIDYAKEIGTPLFCQSHDFGYEKKETSWNWWSKNEKLENLPLPSLALQNMATVLMAIELLQKKLPVKLEQIKEGLQKVKLPGRIQVVPGEITHIFDVSHNPAAAEFLAKKLREIPAKKTRAVFSMLGDKDITATILLMKDLIDEWYVAPLTGVRAASQDQLDLCFKKAKVNSVIFYSEIISAYQAALEKSQPGDCLVIFGSFHTVAAIAPATRNARAFASI